MRESSTYQAILEEGRSEGRSEGLVEGRREGLTEGLTAGAVAEARKFLRKAGDRAFGAPDAPTAALIEGITDLTRLEALFDRVPTVSSWPELLGQPAPSRSRGRRRRAP